jgi:hypothetical protein
MGNMAADPRRGKRDATATRAAPGVHAVSILPEQLEKPGQPKKIFSPFRTFGCTEWGLRLCGYLLSKTMYSSNFRAVVATVTYVETVRKP